MPISEYNRGLRGSSGPSTRPLHARPDSMKPDTYTMTRASKEARVIAATPTLDTSQAIGCIMVIAEVEVELEADQTSNPSPED